MSSEEEPGPAEVPVAAAPDSPRTEGYQEEEEPEEHADHEGYVVLELTVPEGKGGGDTMEAMMEEKKILV